MMIYGCTNIINKISNIPNGVPNFTVRINSDYWVITTKTYGEEDKSTS